MSDFPNNRYHKPVISNHGIESLGAGFAASSSSTPASATYGPGANVGLWCPFQVWSPYNCKTLWWANGTAVAGNVDCGIYTIGGTRLVSTTPTAQAGTSVVQSVALGTAILLAPGSYYMALSASSASATFFRTALSTRWMAALGVAKQGSVGTLPATMTLATLDTSYVPIFGLASTTVI